MTPENDPLEQIRALRIVPVVSLSDLGDAPALGAALAAGGLPVAEITFRTPVAAAAIAAVRSSCPDVLVGAGTVLDVPTARRAIDAGAQFVVSPGLDPGVVQVCQNAGVSVIPGVVTPTEVIAAIGLGLRLLKFFPAGAYGGVGTLAALNGPFGGVEFMPTGGITPANLKEYLSLPNVAACGGTWIATSAAIAHHQFDEIARLAGQARTLAALNPQ